jgi:hypothetical protein
MLNNRVKASDVMEAAQDAKNCLLHRLYFYARNLIFEYKRANYTRLLPTSTKSWKNRV